MISPKQQQQQQQQQQPSSKHQLSSAPPLPPQHPVHSVSSAKLHSAITALTALSHDLHLAKGGGASLDDVEKLGLRVWNSSVMYEHRRAALEQEQAHLKRLIENCWSQFDQLILPVYHLDETLNPVYRELVDIKCELKRIKQESDFILPNKTGQDFARLVHAHESKQQELRERLLEIEEHYHREGGKFVPADWKQTDPVPAGQAIISSLLHQCFRFLRLDTMETEFEVSSELLPFKQKLDTLISVLRSVYDRILISTTPLEMGEIKLIQDELTALSKWRNSSGLFMNEKTGEVPEIGQEILSSLCEQAWDLVHDCLVEMDHQREATTAKARKASGSGANALHRLQEIRDVLLNYAYGAEQATLPILSAIGGSLNVLAKPLESGASKLLSTARSAYQYLGEAMKDLEPVAPALQPVLLKLSSVRSQLKDLRNRKDSLRYLEMVKEETEESKAGEAKELEKMDKELIMLQQELDGIDQGKIDGKWVSANGEICKGQAILSAVLDECYCLVSEIQFH